MFELTNRELATVILFAGVLLTFTLVPRLRRQVGPSFLGVLRSLFVWKIQLPLLLYFCYATLVVYAAWRLGTWELSLLKDTAVIAVFVGLPMLFSANQVREGKKLVRQVVRDSAGVSALLVFYLGFGSLPLWSELLLQPFIAVLVLLSAVVDRKPEHQQVKTVANVILGLVGLMLFLYTTNLVLRTWDAETVSDAVASLALSILLPIELIPFVYVFAFIMYCESLLTMLPYVNNKQQPQLRVRFAGIWGLRLSVKLASEFSGQWRPRLAQAGGFREATQTMREFRHAVWRRDRGLRAYEERLNAMTGVDGSDEDGLRLDRREFAATKRELINLYFMQMGWYRNHGRKFKADLLDLLGSMTGEGLPQEHGIKLLVSTNGQAWRAWRQTPGGWYFGVGGTSDLEEQWQYDGPAAPAAYPSKDAPGWINASREASSIEWSHNDEPPKWTELPNKEGF